MCLIGCVYGPEGSSLLEREDRQALSPLAPFLISNRGRKVIVIVMACIGLWKNMCWKLSLQSNSTGRWGRMGSV